MKHLKEVLEKVGITKETCKRAGRTFLQTATGYILVNAAVIDFSAGKEVVKSAICGLIISAIAAGVAAVMNLDKNTESEGEING